MWQQEKKDSAIVRLALLLALATTPTAGNLFVSAPLRAQSTAKAPSFPLPQTMENGTTVRIDGSSSLATINQNLKQSFEKQFSGAKVEVAANGTDAALKALLDGKIDVAAIGRGLTPQEKAQGLEQVRLRREKIAIVVGAENPFKGSLTDRQFARIFRGKITNWSQLGVSKGKIRVIDRPATNDTRDNLRSYPVFKAANFATGSTGTQMVEDNTAEIVKQLGKDGISYAIANQVSKMPSVRVIQLHQTSPDDPKYPFSQPLVYIYKKNPSPAVAGFLGFTLASPGKQAIEEARVAEAAAIARGESPVSTVATNSASTPETTPAPIASPIAEATPAAITSPIAEVAPVPIASANAEATPTPWGPKEFTGTFNVATSPNPEVTPNVTTLAQQQPILAPPQNSSGKGPIAIWLLLLPLAAIGGLLLWFIRRPSADGQIPESTTNEPLPLTPANFAEETHITSNLAEDTTSIGSNTEENLTLARDTALAGGVAIGVGAATLSGVSVSDSQETQKNNKSSNYTVITYPDFDESPWDMEAPAAVVNTSYPQRTEVSRVTSDVDWPNADISDVIPDLSDITEVAVAEELTTEQSHAELNSLEDINITTTEIGTLGAEHNIWSLLQGTDDTNAFSHEMTSDVELSTTDLSDIPEVELDGDDWDIPVAGEQSQAELDSLEDITSTESATLGAEADLSIWSLLEDTDDATVVNEEVTSDVEASTTDLSDTPEAELDGDYWDTPVAGEESQAELDSLEDITSTESATLGAEADLSIWSILEDIDETTTVSEVTSDVELPIPDITSLPEFPDIPEEALNVVADAAETTEDETPEETEVFHQASLENLAAGAALAGVGTGAWASIYGIPNTSNSEVQEQTNTTIENVTSADTTSVDLPDAEEQSSIVLTPRTPEWAFVSWYVSHQHKQALRDAGISQLSLRLYDATNVDLSYQSPQLLRQYECEEITYDRYIAIPMSERDYISEIGYVMEGDSWVTIARSAIVHVFSHVHTDTTDGNLPILNATSLNPLDGDEQSSIVFTPRTPKWAYVSWYISHQHKQTLRDAGVSQLFLRLYDVTDIDLSYQSPQLLRQYECEEVTQDRYLVIPKSDRDYMIEIGYVTPGDRWVTMTRSATVHVFKRPHGDFWFVADAELIIHGATEPGSTVTIAGNSVALKSDGTFNLRIPFSDSLIEYLITADAANGEQSQTIHKRFSQETPES